MNDPDKIDFGPLDPCRDEARWHRLVAQTARRAREQHARGVQTVSGQLVAWGRPALAVAAALSLVVTITRPSCATTTKSWTPYSTTAP